MANVTRYEVKGKTAADGTTAKAHRWEVRYRLPNGQTTRKRGFTTRKAAEAFMHQTEVSKAVGGFVSQAAGRLTVATVSEAWIRGQDARAAKTRSVNLSAARAHVLPKWGTTPLAKVRRSDVQAWVGQLAAEGKGAATIERAVGVLRQILDLAVADGSLVANPAADVSAPKRTHRSRGYLSHAQVHDLAVEAGPRGRDLVLFLAYTGLRIGEAAGLRARDIDLARRRVTVERTVTEVGVARFKAPKTHERRTVPFPAFLDEVMVVRVRGRGLDDPVFTSEAGTVLTPSNWRARTLAPAVVTLVARTTAVRAEEAAGAADGHPVTPEFPTVTTHDLRHTAASLAISAGANVKAVQRMLGHAKASMTLDTYADLFPDDLERVAAALAEHRAAALAPQMECVQSVSTESEEAL